MAFPFTGRSQLLGIHMTSWQRKAMAKWRLGQESTAALDPKKILKVIENIYYFFVFFF
jgi:hypothetical protein